MTAKAVAFVIAAAAVLGFIMRLALKTSAGTRRGPESELFRSSDDQQGPGNDSARLP